MDYITAEELIAFLRLVPGETHVKIPGHNGSVLATDFYYHELTGVHIS